MNRTARTLAAVATTAALALTGQAVQSAASAKPDHAGGQAKGGQAKGVAPDGSASVLRAIDRAGTALDRTMRENRIGTLAEEIQALLHANVESDKLTLTGLASSVTAADSTVDLRQVRRDVQQLRPENYVLSVNVLRQAARVAEAAAGNADVTARVDSAVVTALTVTASSPKSLVREARAALAEAQALLDTEPEPEPAPVTPVTP